jgi:Fe-S-cluster containining protein
MQSILQNYGNLLNSVDQWFSRCVVGAGAEIACAQGCSFCCRGLFDITLLDASYLKTGFDQLDESTRQLVRGKAVKRLAMIRKQWPEFDAPYILNVRPEQDWQMLMPEDDETACPLLSDAGECLVYYYRPMTCRLHGLPNVDFSGEVFSEGCCTLNFSGENPLDRKELHWGFTDCFQIEKILFQQFTHSLLKQNFKELDTIIPMAVLIDFEGFDWQAWRDVFIKQ